MIDTFDYDAFGNLINLTGSTPNNYLYSGEQWDSDLHLYYNRARYLDVRVGRFWGMDTHEGDEAQPERNHDYLYAGSDPVDRVDPEGEDFIDFSIANSISSTLDSMPTIQRPQPNTVPFGRGLVRDASETSDLGLRFITGHEGWRAHHYPDADGNCTIGYGHLLHYGKCQPGDLDNISKEVGLEFFRDDVKKFENEVKRRVKVPLAQQEFDALTDFAFNSGSVATSLSQDLNSGLYATIPFKLLKYVYTHREVDGKRVPVLLDNLVTRRSEEGFLWVFGVYRVNGAVIGQLHYVP